MKTKVGKTVGKIILGHSYEEIKKDEPQLLTKKRENGGKGGREEHSTLEMLRFENWYSFFSMVVFRIAYF